MPPSLPIHLAASPTVMNVITLQVGPVTAGGGQSSAASAAAAAAAAKAGNK